MSDLLAESNGGNVPALDLIFMITLVALLPSVAVMTTSFTRIVIILSFTRNAVGAQQASPNMALVGMALFLILCIMNPAIGKINEEMYQSYVGGGITQQKVAGRTGGPLEELMLRNTEKSTLDHFVQTPGTDIRENVEDYSLAVMTSAFMASGSEWSFMSNFLIHLSFFLIDIVVTVTPMSAGMAMLPPTIIALPFRLLLFVTMNRWELLFSSIIQNFRQNAREGGRKV